MAMAIVTFRGHSGFELSRAWWPVAGGRILLGGWLFVTVRHRISHSA
ncbi:hypothetical protein [Pseudonocardia acaciae]|nr:hypothetical protein [Pseudonocardia acaciae]